MSEQITNHVERALARLPEQHKNKPKLIALLTALAGPAQGIEDALWQLLVERFVDTAIGDQLDTIGGIVGQPRNGMLDAEYRRFIRARVSVRRSNGVTEDILRVVNLILFNDGATLTIERYPEEAAYVLRVEGVAVAVSTATHAAAFMRDATSAGVRSMLEYSESAPEDTFQLGDATEAVAMTGKPLADINTKSLQLTRADSDYASITDAAQTGLDIAGGITLGAWVRWDSLPTDAGPDVYTIMSKWLNTGNQKAYKLLHTNVGGSLMRIYGYVSSTGANEAGVNCDFTPTLGQWYSVIFRFDPSIAGNMNLKCKIWIDGVSQALSAVNAPLTTIFDSTADFAIGREMTALVPGYFDGNIDEAFVYDGVLDDDAVARWAAGMPPEDPTDYALYCRFEDDYTDKSGNDNELTPGGSPAFEAEVPFDGDEYAGKLASAIGG